jgi:diacylglycerol kinase
MREIADEPSKNTLSADDSGIDTRVFRTMAIAVALAVIVSLPLAPWRITVGLLVGGLLSLLNYHWLRSSISAGFDLAVHGAEPRIKLAQYILRYFVLAIFVFAAYKLNLVSLPATLAGLCSFVIALFSEAFRELYFAIIHREENS